jgi:amidase
MSFLNGPTTEELTETAARLGFHIADSDLEFYRTSIDGTVGAYKAIAALDEALPAVKYPRTPGYQPMGDENKYNAWYRKTDIRGASSGKLKGKTVAIKDNVCVAGVPMMNGASTLEGYVPEIDATVVRRLLDAGATIAGKAHCEYFCFSGGSFRPAGPLSTRASRDTPRAARRQGAQRYWLRGRSTSPSAGIRAAQSGSPLLIVASTG